MDWTTTLITLGFMVLGYLIGSISYSILIGKIFKLSDVRKNGSGNAGATNTLRQHGTKFGFIVFILDALKPVSAMLIALPLRDKCFIPAAGIATVIGHIYPIFFGFKGGKGAACFVGFISTINWVLFFVGLILFIIIMTKWHIVSIASLVCPLILLILYIVFGIIDFRPDWMEPITNFYSWWKVSITITIIWFLIIFKHKDNIKRIITKKERKTIIFKK